MTASLSRLQAASSTMWTNCSSGFSSSVVCVMPSSAKRWRHWNQAKERKSTVLAHPFHFTSPRKYWGNYACKTPNPNPVRTYMSCKICENCCHLTRRTATSVAMDSFHAIPIMFVVWNIKKIFIMPQLTRAVMVNILSSLTVSVDMLKHTVYCCRVYWGFGWWWFPL